MKIYLNIKCSRCKPGEKVFFLLNTFIFFFNNFITVTILSSRITICGLHFGGCPTAEYLHQQRRYKNY
jgi:hypothetical protein